MDFTRVGRRLLGDQMPSSARERSRTVLERLVVALALAGTTALLFARLDEPFDESGSTQRLFAASRPWRDLLRQPDFRHPVFFFVCLRASLGLETWLGFEATEAFARLPAALAAWVAALLTWWTVRGTLGKVRALVVLVLLALCPPFLLHAREVGNLTLFMAVVVATSGMLCLLIKRFSWARVAVFMALETLMFHTNYLSALVWSVHVATVAVHARGRERRLALASLAASLALSFKPLMDLATTIPVDMGLRTAARAYPDLVWGQVGMFEWLREAAAWFVTLDGWGVSLVLVAGLGVLRLARQAPRSPFAFLYVVLVLAVPVLLAMASSLLRLQPSYLGFLSPAFAVLVAGGAMGWPHSGRMGAKAMLGALVAMAAIVILARDSRARVFGTAPMDGYRILGQFLKTQPGKRVVATDHHGPATLVMYYAFEEPARMVFQCRHGIGKDIADDELPLECDGPGGTYVALSDYTRPGPKTESLALRRFRKVAPEWYVEDTRLRESQALAAEVRGRCSIVLDRPPVRLFWCGDAAAPRSSGGAR